MPTYRSDVVGSLLRPASLKGARERYASGGLSDAEFKRLEERAVNDVVALQEQAGLDVISDGEIKYPEVCGTYFPGENTRLLPMAALLTLGLHAVPERGAYPLSPVLQTLSISGHINRATFIYCYLLSTLLTLFLFLEKFV